MKKTKILSSCTLLVFLFIFSEHPIWANDKGQMTAEEKVIWQLEAIKDDSYPRFIQYGNKAFKEFYDEWHFDSVKLSDRSKILKGYQLKYLGAIKRIGMTEPLWKVNFSGEKYEILARIVLSHGKVVGFNLD
ncbi:MAG TPA: hypothetical protein VGB26_10070 [Nitrospiria bacterium]